MTTRTRLDTLEHLLADLNLADRCPDCRAPHRSSPCTRLDAETVGGVCESCRRVLDRDGLPISGRSFVLAIVNDPPEAPTFTIAAAGAPVCWGEDGKPVLIDAARVTIIEQAAWPL